VQPEPFVNLGGDSSPDSRDRIEEFLARHGGAGKLPSRGAKNPLGEEGWSEVYAADGYTLRCEWSRMGSHEEMRFSELAPRAGGAGESSDVRST
jgi:hypothetical protein